MILSFACKQTHALFQNRRCKLPLGKALAVAYRKLVMIHSAGRLDDLRVPRAIGWKLCEAIGKGSSVSGSISSGEFALPGETATRMMWQS